MSIIVTFALRPFDGAIVTKEGAANAAKLVPVPAGDKWGPPMPQGHTTVGANDRLDPSTVRPWVQACVERLGGVAAPGMYVLPDSAKEFVKALQKTLEKWGGMTVVTGVPSKLVEHIVREVRVAALAEAVEHATSPDDLFARLVKAGADKAEMSKAIVDWTEGNVQRLRELAEEAGVTAHEGPRAA